MILIADSGSTKTDWLLVGKGGDGDGARAMAPLHTQGINPFHQGADVIREILRSELLPQIEEEGARTHGATGVTTVRFYGSGVRPELEPVMAQLLREAFPQATDVEAHNDLLGAARALCGHNYGIASILGTGANSCLYDGEHIVENTPPLGYILGDEGSGAVLGRRFLNALYKGVLSKELHDAFVQQTGLTMADVIDRVYRQPLANRFLASLCPFVHDHLDDEAVCGLVVDSFRDFFRRNIVPYGRRDLPVSFVGSVAWYFQEQLAVAAHNEGFLLGNVLKSPLIGLVSFERLKN